MNAGAHGCCISDLIQSVKLLDEQGKMMDLSKEQLGFDYRTSALQEGIQLAWAEERGHTRHSPSINGRLSCLSPVSAGNVPINSEGRSFRTVVVEATFNCRYGDQQTIKKQMEQYIAKRKAVQPQGYPNAGSVFKNPSGESAGRLIEMAGCKGLRVGQAAVSTVHANWIVNLGAATAKDVIELINIIKNRVKDKFNVVLQLEVRVLG